MNDFKHFWHAFHQYRWFFAKFRAPPLVEGCGLRFEGTGWMWKGTRTGEETLYEGDLSGVSGRVSKWQHLPLFLIRNRATKILWLQVVSKAVERYRFDAQNLSLPTTTQAGETSRFATHIQSHFRQLPRDAHHTPYCRHFDSTICRRHVLEPRLEVAGACDIVGVYYGGRYELVGGSQRCERPPSPETHAAM